MTETINFSVGKINGLQNCKNDPADKSKVIRLINSVDAGRGGSKEKPVSDDGRKEYCSPELHTAILTFQRKHSGLTADGHIDPTGGTLKKLNELTKDVADDTVPLDSSFKDLPEPVMDLLRRSYALKTASNEFLANGFREGELPSNTPFRVVLDRMESAGRLVTLLKELFDRTSHTRAFWPLIQAVGVGWRGTSRGFMFVATDGRDAERILRNSPKFCADLPPGQAMHQLGEKNQHRQCYRELSGVGLPGLHVCIVPTSEEKEHGWHNIHIDPHQVARDKTRKCTCWYAGLKGHFEDVGEWICETQAYPFVRKTVADSTLLPALAKVLLLAELDKPSVKDAVVKAMLKAMLAGSGGFDEIEKISSGDLPPGLALIPDAALVIRSILGGFKAFYMNNV